MSTHAQLSPSKAHRWTVCPGSIREEAKYPDVTGQAAVDGTHSHTLLEQAILTKTDPLEFIGRVLADHEGEFTVDKERATRVAVAYSHIQHRVKELGNATVMAEGKVNPALLLPAAREDLGGTVDVQIHAGSHVDVIDYKDGMGVVDVKDNKQLELYALGVLARYLGRFKTVRMTIIQPKLALRGMKAITSHDLTTEELLAKVPFYAEAAAATDKPDAPLVPGDSQCKFCKAKGSCGALASNVMEAIGMFKSIDIAQQAADKNPNELSDDQIREIVESAPLVRQLLEAVEAEALRRFTSGQSIKGLKVVYGRGTRKWALPDEQIAEKLIKMKVPKTSIYETKIISPSVAEKLIWSLKNGELKQLSPRQLKILESEYTDFEDNCIQTSKGKLTLTLESDHRQAVILDAAPMFGAVNSEPEIPAWLK